MIKTFVLAAALIGLMACGQSTTSNTSEAEEVATSSESSTTYQVQTSESNVEWFGEKITGWAHKGTVMVSSGSFAVQNNEITAGSFEIDMNSITEIESQMPEEKVTKLIGHLKSPDFFDVGTHPTASFAISSVQPDSLRGNLSIKGITKSITIPYSIEFTDNQMHATSQFTIDRSEFDVRFGSGSFFEDLGDELIKDEIQFTVALHAAQAE
ncbi:MAG: YceI family protein [Bacteroidia bacterium]